MKVKKIAAVYSIIVGISMIGMWTVFYVTGGIPEINTESAKIAMHLIAEFVTAIALILGGFGLISNRKWGECLRFICRLSDVVSSGVRNPGIIPKVSIDNFIGIRRFINRFIF